MNSRSERAIHPLDSVITVSLNAASSIEDTIRSVAQQRASFDIEHVCIDGGSVDGTREIINHYAGGNPTIVRLFEPDQGLFDAMNKGLRIASGDYVLFLNADDFLVSPISIASAFADLNLEPGKENGPDMVMGDVVMARPGRFGFWRMRRVPRWLSTFPGLGAHPPHQGNFIKRSLLLKAGGFDAGQRLAADTTQFYRLVHEFHPTMHICKTVVTFMRMGGASNRNLSAYRRGNGETYRFLRRYKSQFGSAVAVGIKIMQKLLEYRLGLVQSSACELAMNGPPRAADGAKKSVKAL
jgi:glycosyltransferase